MLEDKAPAYTKLSELGEFGLIQHLTKNIVIKNSSTIKGVGDDAAVLDYKDKKIVVTTDLLIEGIHFDLIYNPLKHLGYKAVAVNLSDVFAMNAMPKQITVSIAVSNNFSVELLEELYSGINLACEKYNVDLIGGDTTSSNIGLVISITAIGEIENDNVVYRSGAKETDLVCLSGDVGSAYIGLLILEREKQIFQENPKIQPDLDGCDYVLERQLKPEPRADVIKILKEKGIIPTSMIDVSDGVASEVLHICKESDIGCKIYEEKIPIDSTAIGIANNFNLDPTTCALNGGEDYELLFTVKLEDYEKVKDIPEITIIGHICEKNEGANLIARQGSEHPLQAQGWNAFLKEKENEL